MDGRRRRQYPLARPGLTTRNSQLQTGNCKLSCVTDAETEIRYYCVCIVLEVRRCRCLFPVGCCRCLSPVFPLLMKIEMSYWPGFASDSSLVGNHSFAAKLQIWKSGKNVSRSHVPLQNQIRGGWRKKKGTTVWVTTLFSAHKNSIGKIHQYKVVKLTNIK